MGMRIYSFILLATWIILGVFNLEGALAQKDRPPHILAPSTASQDKLNTDMINAAGRGDIAAVKQLLGKGASITYQDKDGFSPLFAATMKGHKEMISFLLERGAQINNNRTKEGLTPLHFAALENNAEIIKLMLDKGADIKAKDKSGNTALHAAAAKGGREAVEILINKGLNVDIKNNLGETPLHFAAIWGNLPAARLLLSKGADTNIKSNKGLTPLYIALKEDRANLVQLLKENSSENKKNRNKAKINIINLTISKSKKFGPMAKNISDKVTYKNIEEDIKAQIEKAGYKSGSEKQKNAVLLKINYVEEFSVIHSTYSKGLRGGITDTFGDTINMEVQLLDKDSQLLFQDNFNLKPMKVDTIFYGVMAKGAEPSEFKKKYIDKFGILLEYILKNMVD